MEDAHIAETELGDGNCLFGVFDGHGGPEVALFTRAHFTKNLINHPSYKKRDYQTALEQTFIKMDRLLMTEKGKQELKGYMEDESETRGMYGGLGAQ